MGRGRDLAEHLPIEADLVDVRGIGRLDHVSQVIGVVDQGLAVRAPGRAAANESNAVRRVAVTPAEGIVAMSDLSRNVSVGSQ